MNKSLICMLPSLYSTRTGMIKPRFRWRESFDSVRDISLHPSKHGLSNTDCRMIRATRTETTVPPREVSEEFGEIRTLDPVKVPKTAGSRREWRRWCKRGGNSNKTVIRGAKRRRD